MAKGAYILFLFVERPLVLVVGSLGAASIPPGHYAYVGSALGGVGARVARHRRLADSKSGKVHWHIDYLLTNPHVFWDDAIIKDHSMECSLSRRIALISGVTVPIRGFGASDCRANCSAHLYQLPEGLLSPDLTRILQNPKAGRC